MPEQAVPPGLHAKVGLAEARAALVAWVEGGGASGRRFLQVQLRRTGPERFEIRHASDLDRPLGSLDPVTSDPYVAREIAQTTETGEHRPLKTAPNLRRGWALTDLDPRTLWIALDYLYPACARHWHAGEEQALRVTHWREVAARQSGIYSSVKLLADDAVRNTVRACCGNTVCLRQVAWEIDETNPLALPSEAAPEGARVPCPEACSLFISFARKVLTIERAPREPIRGLVPLNGAELEQLREVVAATATGTLGATREGDFSEPTNLRRIRYLAARLNSDVEL